MYELAATLQTIDRILTNAVATEAAIYQADDWFQAHIVPWVEERAKRDEVVRHIHRIHSGGNLDLHRWTENP